MDYCKDTCFALNTLGMLQAKVTSGYYSDNTLGPFVKYFNISYCGYFYSICRILV